MEYCNGIGKECLAVLVADIVSASIPNTMMDMNIGLTAIGVSCQHKQVIYTRITQSIDCADDNLQNLLGFIVLKILDRLNM